MASAAAVTEDASAEPVNYKTCVLRVSIHCEGCKKKVKKILKKIHGVEDIIIDSKIHKVTVIGNVNGEALLRKLLIKGKHAEFWPAPPPPQKVTQTKEKKQETLKSDEIKKDPQPQISKDGNSGEPEQKNQSKPEEQKIQVKVKNITINGETSNDNSNKSANEGVQADKGVNGPTQESKAEGKLPANSSPVNHTPATDNTGIENGVAAGTDKVVGSGIVRKKKGKKGQKSIETSETVQIPGDAAGSVGSSTSHPASQATESVYRGPSSRQHANPYPSYDSPPTYVMSYNTANPSGSYSETYYAQPPTYTYSQPPPPYMYAQPPPPSFMYSDSPPQQHPQQQSDSFTMFSDENANGCSIM